MEENKLIWGRLNNIEEIKKALRDILQEDIGEIKSKHIPSGFTDNVFLVEVVNKKFIVKEYLEDWHAREVKTYTEILNTHEALSAPKILYSSNNLIIMEYLSSDNYRNFNINDLSILKTWIINKHQITFKVDTTLYKEPVDIQKKYLILKPLNIIEKLLIEAKFEDLNDMLLNLKNRKEQYLLFLKENDELPNILEHGDLETQNLLFNRITGQIKVLDWVNTRFGSGLVDINQYIENYVEVMVKTDLNLEAFEQLYTGYDFHRLLNQTRVLMLLNKINFYAGKILDGVEYSESKRVRNYEMLKKFVVEANLIITSL